MYSHTYYIYPCPRCSCFHISTTGFSAKHIENIGRLRKEILEMVQNGEGIIVRRISKRRSVKLVEHEIGTFLVEHRKRNGKCKPQIIILNEIFI